MIVPSPEVLACVDGVNSRPPSIEGVVAEIDVSGFQVTFCAASTGLAGTDDDTTVSDAVGFFVALVEALGNVLTELGAGNAWAGSDALSAAAVNAADAEAAGAAAVGVSVALGAEVGTTMRTSVTLLELRFQGGALSEVAMMRQIPEPPEYWIESCAAWLDHTHFKAEPGSGKLSTLVSNRPKSGLMVKMKLPAGPTAVLGPPYLTSFAQLESTTAAAATTTTIVLVRIARCIRAPFLAYENSTRSG